MFKTPQEAEFCTCVYDTTKVDLLDSAIGVNSLKESEWRIQVFNNLPCRLLINLVDANERLLPRILYCCNSGMEEVATTPQIQAHHYKFTSVSCSCRQGERVRICYYGQPYSYQLAGDEKSCTKGHTVVLMKYTAQMILKELRNNHPHVLEKFVVKASDRKHQIWERRPMSTSLWI